MSDDVFGRSNEHLSARAAVEQCLRMVMALTPAELRDPQIRLALSAISSSVQSLLVQNPVVENEIPTNPSVDDAEQDEPSPQFRRARVRTNSEKLERKARLEKREAILKDLRSRVNKFKDELDDVDAHSGQQQDVSLSLETFQARLQKASFWTVGSPEWARQLLGIELGMTDAERRQCYIQMVKFCHPDHNAQLGADAILQVNAAWEVIRQ
ncbi:MAG: hypothetical protein RL189_2994 [Pseudomonadota bacterium]|jgi:hypothetical protein